MYHTIQVSVGRYDSSRSYHITHNSAQFKILSYFCNFPLSILRLDPTESKLQMQGLLSLPFFPSVLFSRVPVPNGKTLCRHSWHSTGMDMLFGECSGCTGENRQSQPRARMGSGSKQHPKTGGKAHLHHTSRFIPGLKQEMPASSVVSYSTLLEDEPQRTNKNPKQTDTGANTVEWWRSHTVQWLMDQLLSLAATEAWKDGIIRCRWYISTGGLVKLFPVGLTEGRGRSLRVGGTFPQETQQEEDVWKRQCCSPARLCFLLMSASNSPVTAAIHHLTQPLWPCHMSGGQWLPGIPLGFQWGLQRHPAALCTVHLYLVLSLFCG